MKKTSSGISSSELLIIVAILGLLAYMLLPHYSNVTSNGRIAAVTSLAKSLNQYSYMVNSQYRINGGIPVQNSTGTNTNVAQVNVTGKAITVIGGLGYPTADVGGMGLLYQSLPAFKEVYDTHVVIFEFKDAIKNCNVVYNEMTGKATAVTTGC